MPDPVIGFLRQPLDVLARGGETLATRTIHMLKDWVLSGRKAHVASHHLDRLYILASDSRWNVVVIPRARREAAGGDWIEVCAVADAGVSDLMAHFTPLTKLDHLTALMEVKLANLDASVFPLVAESLDPSLYKPFLESPYLPNSLQLSAAEHSALRLLDMIDTTTDRWASSKARSQFKSVLDDALERPQVVEREGDDLVIVSRRYLRETIDPTSAKALSQRYLAMGLSDAEMPQLTHGTLPPLDELPAMRRL